MEACFYGLDSCGRGIASRMSNLAHATIADARVTSAETLGNAPSRTMLMAGIASCRVPASGGTPQVSYSDDRLFPQRLRTAMDSAERRPKRVVVDVSATVGDADLSPEDEERIEQHLAVVLLDAFCMAFA